MRVLQVTPALAPVYGGPSRVVSQLSRAIAAQGVRVDIVTTNAAGVDVLPVRLGEPLWEDGVRTYYFPRQWPRGYTFSRPLWRWLLREVGNYDVVHVNAVFSFSTAAASRAALRRSKPYVVSPHGMLAPWCLRYKRWKKAPYYRFVERRTLTAASAIHALTPGEADAIRSLGLATPVFVVPNGVNCAEFQSLPPRDLLRDRHPELMRGRLVVFLGRLDPIKGLDVLIGAFARMLRARSDLSDVRLVLAGPDLTGYRRTLEELARTEGLAGRVHWTGWVDGAERLAILGAADVVVLPSRFEEFPVVVLEAMAAGRPVIISSACNIARDIQSGGAGLAVPLDDGGLEEAMARMLSDEDLRRAIGESGRRLASERYGWSAIADRMIRAYEGIVGDRGKLRTVA